MRLTAALLILLGMLLITFGRSLIRRSRKTPSQKSRLTGWTLTFLGFLAILLGVTLWS